MDKFPLSWLLGSGLGLTVVTYGSCFPILSVSGDSGYQRPTLPHPSALRTGSGASHGPHPKFDPWLRSVANLCCGSIVRDLRPLADYERAPTTSPKV